MKIHLFFLLILGVLLGCTPSGNIEDYSEYFVNDQRQLNDGEIAVTFFGVSTLLFDDGTTRFMIDGFLSRPSSTKVLFSKLSTEKSLIDSFIAQYQLEDLEAILINHTHYDHALDAAYFAKKAKAKIFGSLSAMNLGKGEGVSDSLLHEFNEGDHLTIGEFKIEVLRGKHSPPKVLNADLGEVISEPLTQPARFSAYKEGGTFDFAITHRDHTIFVKASPNYIEDALNDVRADVLFLATGSIGSNNKEFINTYYDETVAKLQPKLLIPIHWDNFLKSDTRNLVMMPRYMDNGDKTFGILKERCHHENIDLKILKGHARIVLP